jgi:hypothetical protein
MSVLSILGTEGDTTLTWNRENPVEIKTAEDKFLALQKEGYLAFRLEENGEKGELIREFNPNIEKIFMAPQMAGG